MTKAKRSAWLAGLTESPGQLLTMDGYDDCIIGLVTRAGTEPFLVYDRAQVIAKLMKRDKMSRNEAQEFHDFNQAEAYLGPGTPGFIDRP